MNTLAPLQTTADAFTCRKATYQEYLDSADDTRIVEWADEEIITYMPPTNLHQDIVRFLAVLIDGFVRALNMGHVRFAPFEVKLWSDGPSREPDILFISTENEERLTNKRVVGAPDLVIEVVSPGTAKIDQVDKFTEYERAGVKEYWLIDVRPYRQQADFYVRNDNGRFEEAPIHDGGIYKAAILSGLWLRLDWLWQTPLPNPQQCLAELLMTADGVPVRVQAAYKTLYEALTTETDKDD